jgi:hypothetical protein
MQNNPHLQPVSSEALQRKHESKDPPLYGILLVAGLVVLTVVSCLAAIWILLHLLSATRPVPAAQTLGILTAPSQELIERFPAPHLQIMSHQDLLALRTREDMELTNYGWLDRTSGVVRIPISRAMDLICQRGLPSAATNGTPVPGKSSLELIRERTLPK